MKKIEVDCKCKNPSLDQLIANLEKQGAVIPFGQFFKVNV